MAKKARSTAVERRKDLETIAQWAKETNNDPRSLVLLLKDIALRCVDEGYDSDSVCMKSDTGMVTLNQRFPAVAVTAIGQIHKILLDCQKELEKEPPADPIVNLIIGRKRLEEVLEEQDDE